MIKLAVQTVCDVSHEQVVVCRVILIFIILCPWGWNMAQPQCTRGAAGPPTTLFFYDLFILSFLNLLACLIVFIYAYISISAPMLLDFPSSIYAQKHFSCEL